jgi:hypothetical protein
MLTAMIASRFTLLGLGKTLSGVGVHVEDLLFGGSQLLADERLSEVRRRREMVIATHLLAFDDFVMTPCTSFLDFDPEFARMLTAGLPKESTVPMAERYASPLAMSELATDLTEMALCSIESVKEALVERFDSSSRASVPR